MGPSNIPLEVYGAYFDVITDNDLVIFACSGTRYRKERTLRVKLQPLSTGYRAHTRIMAKKSY